MTGKELLAFYGHDPDDLENLLSWASDEVTAGRMLLAQYNLLNLLVGWLLNRGHGSDEPADE